MYVKVVQDSCVSLLGGGGLGEKRREEGSGKLSNVSTELPFLLWLIRYHQILVIDSVSYRIAVFGTG